MVASSISGTTIPAALGSRPKRTGACDPSIFAEAKARAKAKAKVRPKPKAKKRNLQVTQSDPESRIAAVDALRAARSNPYLLPEPGPPDD